MANTTREALIAELLCDLDGVAERVSKFPQLISESEDNLKKTIARLDDAGQKYRSEAVNFSELVKIRLSESLNAQVSNKSTYLTDEQCKQICKEIKMFLVQELNKVERQNIKFRIPEIIIISLISSILTIVGIYMILL